MSGAFYFANASTTATATAALPRALRCPSFGMKKSVGSVPLFAAACRIAINASTVGSPVDAK